MKTITNEELVVILEKHKKWQNNEFGGERADLREANLCRAYLSEADFRGADLSEVYLYGAYLSEANLSEANLYRADLSGANLSGADLSGSDLSGAYLSGADLSDAIIDYPIACPEKGSFIAFKKANGYIIELLIPEDALRCSSTSRKCRCSKAKVVSITNFDGTESCITSVPSNHDSSFLYTIGETVEEPDFNPDRWKECSKGIYFFITRQEAIDY